MLRQRLQKLGVAVAFIGLSVSPSHAASTTSSFNVTLTIVASCAINSASDMNFGSASSLAANVDATSTIQITCTNGAPYNVALGKGLYGPDISNRKMQAGANLIGYQLYRDAGRTQPWGETIGLDTATASGSGTAQSFTVYGRVFPIVTPAVGAYADAVTITVTY